MVSFPAHLQSEKGPAAHHQILGNASIKAEPVNDVGQKKFQFVLLGKTCFHLRRWDGKAWLQQAWWEVVGVTL